MTNDFTQSFALDYAGARAKFIAAARQPGRCPRAVVPVSSQWREQITEQAISITQQAVQGLASWPLAAAA